MSITRAFKDPNYYFPEAPFLIDLSLTYGAIAIHRTVDKTMFLVVSTEVHAKHTVAVRMNLFVLLTLFTKSRTLTEN